MTANGSMYSISFGGDENSLEFSGDGCTLFEYTKKKQPHHWIGIHLKGTFYGVQIRPK